MSWFLKQKHTPFTCVLQTMLAACSPRYAAPICCSLLRSSRVATRVPQRCSFLARSSHHFTRLFHFSFASCPRKRGFSFVPLSGFLCLENNPCFHLVLCYRSKVVFGFATPSSSPSGFSKTFCAAHSKTFQKKLVLGFRLKN
jgi:hypothetical protein